MGDIPMDKPPTRTRIPAPANDVRPGLPTPQRVIPVVWTQPQPTTADVTNPQQLQPDVRWSGPSKPRIQTHPVPSAKYAAPGDSPTNTGGFKKNSQSGTGLPDQNPGYKPVKRPGAAR